MYMKRPGKSLASTILVQSHQGSTSDSISETEMLEPSCRLREGRVVRPQERSVFKWIN